MKILQAFKMAFKAIGGNKMRSFLTMLGIIIGVFSVTVLVAYGQGTTSQVTSSITNLGTNMITATLRARHAVSIDLDELDKLRGTGSVNQVAPLITSTLTAKYSTNTHSTTVEGTTQGYDDIRGYVVENGRFIASTDVDNRSYVCVVGVTVADELFGQRNVVGESIRINGYKFTIVGVFEELGDSNGVSQDDHIAIPFTTAQRMFRNTSITTFYANADSDETIDAAVETIEAFMYDKTGDEDLYTVTSQTQLLETLSSVSDTLSLLLAGISGISLLVGGIGIMNIMLVSVTERTREIGIRKAIGAQKMDIMLQFMIEAVLISLAGGLIGLGLAYLVANVIAPMLGATMVMSSTVSLLAVGFSIAVGVLFGSYPANKAANLLPIEALRYE